MLDEPGKAWLGVLMFLLFVAGIDSAFSYLESIVTNICDIYKTPRWKVALWVTVAGIIFSIPFTSNAGWLLLDLVDHFISDYIILIVGLGQCISVGWLWEYESTAVCSPQHRTALKAMVYNYWIAVPVMTYVCVFALEGNRTWGVLVMVQQIIQALIISYCKSGMRFRSWYHEILLCGVDKLSMSITSLSNKDGSRSKWMFVFEFWFAVMIKFFIPIMMMWMFMVNVKADLKDPYGGNSNEIMFIGSLYLFIGVLILIIPLFSCGYPETYSHDVNLEFIADQVYSDALQK
jgi:SNF family Na+-dependent transporter